MFLNNEDRVHFALINRVAFCSLSMNIKDVSLINEKDIGVKHLSYNSNHPLRNMLNPSISVYLQDKLNYDRYCNVYSRVPVYRMIAVLEDYPTLYTKFAARHIEYYICSSKMNMSFMSQITVDNITQSVAVFIYRSDAFPNLTVHCLNEKVMQRQIDYLKQYGDDTLCFMDHAAVSFIIHHPTTAQAAQEKWKHVLKVLGKRNKIETNCIHPLFVKRWLSKHPTHQVFNYQVMENVQSCKDKS